MDIEKKLQEIKEANYLSGKLYGCTFLLYWLLISILTAILFSIFKRKDNQN